MISNASSEIPSVCMDLRTLSKRPSVEICQYQRVNLARWTHQHLMREWEEYRKVYYTLQQGWIPRLTLPNWDHWMWISLLQDTIISFRDTSVAVQTQKRR